MSNKKHAVTTNIFAEPLAAEGLKPTFIVHGYDGMPYTVSALAPATELRVPCGIALAVSADWSVAHDENGTGWATVDIGLVDEFRAGVIAERLTAAGFQELE